MRRLPTPSARPQARVASRDQDVAHVRPELVPHRPERRAAHSRNVEGCATAPATDDGTPAGSAMRERGGGASRNIDANMQQAAAMRERGDRERCNQAESADANVAERLTAGGVRAPDGHAPPTSRSGRS
jgi:hypothetical protein